MADQQHRVRLVALDGNAVADRAPSLRDVELRMCGALIELAALMPLTDYRRGVIEVLAMLLQ